MKNPVLVRAQAETNLAKKLQLILEDSGLATFFRERSELDKLSAWKLWISRHLSKKEMTLYEEESAYRVDNMDDLKTAVAVQSNRIPDEWNVSGY